MINASGLIFCSCCSIYIYMYIIHGFKICLEKGRRTIAAAKKFFNI